MTINGVYAMFYGFFFWFFFVLFFSDFHYKSICCGYSFELHQIANEIHMGTHKIWMYKDVDQKYMDYNLKTTRFLDYVLITVCAVIRSNMVP